MIWIVVIALWNCYDDKGNYSYWEINEITIDTVGRQTEFEVFQFDSLHVEPAIRFAFEEVADEDMEYQWTIFNNVWNNTLSEIIGKERNLHTVIRQPSSATEYSLILQAKNKRSGVATQMTYTVRISSQIVSGVVVLHTDGTQNDIDYIATPRAVPTISASRHISSAYSGVNGVKIPGTPTFVSSARMSSSTGSINAVYIGTKEELYQVAGKTFELEYLSKDLLPVKPAVSNFQTFLSLDRYSNNQFLINNGQLHNIVNQSPFEFQFSYALEPSESLNASAIDLAPFIYLPTTSVYTTGFNAVLYDRLGKRFVMRPRSNYAVTEIMPFTTQQSAVFDVNNIGMDILWFERGYQDYGYAVFKDDAAARWLYIADFNKAMDATIALGRYDMSALPEIADARFYSTGSRGPVFLYATETTIYSYDYNGSKQAVQINDLFPAGEIITAMKVYKPYATTNNLGEADGSLLYVATWDGNEGRLYEFSLNVANGYLGNNKTPLEVFGGMGRIVDFCFKVEGN